MKNKLWGTAGMRIRRAGAGRPGRTPEPGERVKLGLRVTPEMKRRLDTAAAKSGRSQSQEVEHRLERTFDRQDLLLEVLTLSFPGKLPGLLLALGLLMDRAARTAYGPGGDWTSDSRAYAKALDAADYLLLLADPDRVERLSVEDFDDNMKLVAGFVADLKGDGSPDFQHIDTVKRLLGPVADVEVTGTPRDAAFAFTRAAALIRAMVRRYPDRVPTMADFAIALERYMPRQKRREDVAK